MPYPIPRRTESVLVRVLSVLAPDKKSRFHNWNWQQLDIQEHAEKLLGTKRFNGLRDEFPKKDFTEYSDSDLEKLAKGITEYDKNKTGTINLDKHRVFALILLSKNQNDTYATARAVKILADMEPDRERKLKLLLLAASAMNQYRASYQTDGDDHEFYHLIIREMLELALEAPEIYRSVITKTYFNEIPSSVPELKLAQLQLITPTNSPRSTSISREEPAPAEEEKEENISEMLVRITATEPLNLSKEAEQRFSSVIAEQLKRKDIHRSADADQAKNLCLRWFQFFINQALIKREESPRTDIDKLHLIIFAIKEVKTALTNFLYENKDKAGDQLVKADFMQAAAELLARSDLHGLALHLRAGDAIRTEFNEYEHVEYRELKYGIFAELSAVKLLLLSPRNGFHVMLKTILEALAEKDLNEKIKETLQNTLRILARHDAELIAPLQTDKPNISGFLGLLLNRHAAATLANKNYYLELISATIQICDPQTLEATLQSLIDENKVDHFVQLLQQLDQHGLDETKNVLNHSLGEILATRDINTAFSLIDKLHNYIAKNWLCGTAYWSAFITILTHYLDPDNQHERPRVFFEGAIGTIDYFYPEASELPEHVIQLRARAQARLSTISVLEILNSDEQEHSAETIIEALCQAENIELETATQQRILDLIVPVIEQMDVTADNVTADTVDKLRSALTACAKLLDDTEVTDFYERVIIQKLEQATTNEVREQIFSVVLPIPSFEIARAKVTADATEFLKTLPESKLEPGEALIKLLYFEKVLEQGDLRDKVLNVRAINFVHKVKNLPEYKIDDNQFLQQAKSAIDEAWTKYNELDDKQLPNDKQIPTVVEAHGVLKEYTATLQASEQKIRTDIKETFFSAYDKKRGTGFFSKLFSRSGFADNEADRAQLTVEDLIKNARGELKQGRTGKRTLNILRDMYDGSGIDFRRKDNADALVNELIAHGRKKFRGPS